MPAASTTGSRLRVDLLRETAIARAMAVAPSVAHLVTDLVSDARMENFLVNALKDKGYGQMAKELVSFLVQQDVEPEWSAKFRATYKKEEE